MGIEDNDCIFGERLKHPVLGKHYYNAIPKTNTLQEAHISVEPGILPVIPVYMHFLMFDLEPVNRPKTPTILQDFKLFSSYEEKLQLSKYIKQVLTPSRKKI